jgi:nicotinic acid phosphoribosyltransferase
MEHYPSYVARYCFTNRRKTDKFSKAAFEWIQEEISRMESLRLKPDERQWLEKRCPFFKPAYLDFLENFRFKPSQQIEISFQPSTEDPNWGDIKLDIVGLWIETILYEVPIMSLISQAHFLMDDKQWDYRGQKRARPFLLSIKLSWKQNTPTRRGNACLKLAALLQNSVQEGGGPTQLTESSLKAWFEHNAKSRSGQMSRVN